MLLKRDEKGGGTNADGSKNQMFCSHCFIQGRFTLPDITVEQMEERVRAKLRGLGVPNFLSWVFTRNLPRLERWSPKSPG